MDTNTAQTPKPATLASEVAGSTAIRPNIWAETLSRSLTPAALVALLESAAAGYADDYLTIAEEMEEREPQYLSVLGTRKRALSALPITVAAATDGPLAVAHADLVREVIAQPAFESCIEDLLDALGKGRSAIEMIWQGGKVWRPIAFKWRDPRWFFTPTQTPFYGDELRLKTETDPVLGEALQPYKWIIHQPKLKSGLAIRGGLARMVAFVWLCKAYAQKDWMAFAEIFGLPLRIGRYGPEASKEDIAVLKRAVQNLASDAAAVIPDSMKIEFQAAATGQGSQLFDNLCNYLDKQISKAVLGQTMTSDAQSTGLGSSNANVHNDVRLDILAADAKQLARTLNKYLVQPLIDLNFGPQVAYPKIQINLPKPEDLTLLADSLVKLVPLGLQVEESVIRDKFGLPEPAAGARLLMASPTAAPPTLNRYRALNRAKASQKPDEVDAILKRLLESDGADDLAAPIVDLVKSAESYDDILLGLDRLYPDIDDDQYRQLLAEGFLLAYLQGKGSVQE